MAYSKKGQKLLKISLSYYPFGLQQQGYNDVVTSNSNSVANRFSFGGKEFGEELGLDWYDVSARNYDPAIARWMNLDPLAEAMRRHSPYNFAFDNPIYFTDPDGMSPNGCCGGAKGGLLGTGLYVLNRGLEIVKKVSEGESLTSAYYSTYKSDAKQVLRYGTPVEDGYGVVTGENFDGQQYNRAEAVAWGLASFIPFAKLGKLSKVAIKGFKQMDNVVKYSDEVADLVQGTGKIQDESGKLGKEIVTALKEGSNSLNDGIKVAEDVIGGLGDDAVEKLGKFGSQDGVKVGYQSANGKKGWRVDYDGTKGGHINWWNGKEKGAILINSGQNQIDQIIKNSTF
ncbi:RHS repeat-associated core domain-containing protein [uncultured Dokdonia sp.]|uniref:RHS repeat-associated core domain-containing protein n=1 Tax=uncultured Dokdonia sp. TaxID=575653 RepID=UPI002630CCD4|nr:RHS repeat-associated core domain-containing protein [uncultured Dokdonia sp.]